MIRAANPRAVELFGHTEDELIGQPIEFLIPSRYHSTHPAHRENFEAHPRARQMGASLNLFGLRKDLSEFPVDIRSQLAASSAQISACVAMARPAPRPAAAPSSFAPAAARPPAPLHR